MTLQRLRAIVQPGDPEHLASGFEFTEGPVWHPDGFLVFSDIPASTLYRYDPAHGVSVFRTPSGNANGNTRDASGRLLTCEHGNRRVSRTEADGTVVDLATHFDGKRLNSPNDLVAHSDGTLYFTDPPYGIEPHQVEQSTNAVFRLHPDGRLDRVGDDFDRPNGLVFSPDEQTLYVGDSRRRHVRAFQVNADGSLGENRIFADMDHPQPGSPDGMKCDANGNLYVTGATGVWVFEPAGTCLGVIVTPERPANCAWGDDGYSLYVTARTGLYRIRTHVPGAAAVWQR
jgi:gluconolactonase